MQQYKQYLKGRVRDRSWPVTFMFVPMPFSDLIPALLDGRGDVIAAGMTVTPKREQQVAFTKPYLPEVREVVVTAKGVEEIHSIEDLAGRSVYINTATSYAESLESLNELLREQQREPVQVVAADPKFATEDILEMVNAGIIDITISDEHLATVWSKVLPDIDVRHHLAVRTGGNIAWAVRKDNPELLRSLNNATAEASAGTLLGNILFRRYFDNTRWVSNPADQENIGKVSDLRPVFEEFATKNGFDWRIIAAIAFQESRLDPKARSSAGAIGLMQVRPETAAAPAVSIQDIGSVTGNVQAGVRYLAHLRDHYFDDSTMTDADRLDFMLAAYNAGPTRLQGLRVRAKKSGYDPNRWTSNVEHLARRHIGNETIEYVANVNKYYVAYKLSERVLRERVEAKNDLR
jgi:membrane-bound lytic murein transglycosylase MltF